MLRSPENILGQSLSWFTKFNLNHILHRPDTRQKAATEGKANGDFTGLDSNITAKYKGDGAGLFWWCTVKERQAQQMQVPDPEFSTLIMKVIKRGDVSEIWDPYH